MQNSEPEIQLLDLFPGEIEKIIREEVMQKFSIETTHEKWCINHF